MTQTQTALVLGATGLVGRALVSRLLADERYRQVRLLLRRPPALRHPKLEPLLADFERLDAHAPAFAVDHCFVCLGTTLKRAGSRGAFARVDHDYVLQAARLAAAAGVRRFLWISALGADAGSRLFYNRVKGQVERDVAQLPLQWTAVRPSLLLGERDESRPAERAGILLARALGWLLMGPLRPYRAIEADQVAANMIRLANGQRPAPGMQYVAGDGDGAGA